MANKLQYANFKIGKGYGTYGYTGTCKTYVKSL